MANISKRSETKRKVGTVAYKIKDAPLDYKCDKCGAIGVKLWREYETPADVTSLYCARCAGKDQERDVSSISPEGMINTSYGSSTDQIGWLIPAIPVEGRDTYWGYTSVPDEGVSWWRSLPNE